MIHLTPFRLQPIRDSSDTEGTGDRYAFYASADLPLAYLVLCSFDADPCGEREATNKATAPVCAACSSASWTSALKFTDR
jgi:hypothetical protein